MAIRVSVGRVSAAVFCCGDDGNGGPGTGGCVFPSHLQNATAATRDGFSATLKGLQCSCALAPLAGRWSCSLSVDRGSARRCGCGLIVELEGPAARLPVLPAVQQNRETTRPEQQSTVTPRHPSLRVSLASERNPVSGQAVVEGDVHLGSVAFVNDAIQMDAIGVLWRHVQAQQKRHAHSGRLHGLLVRSALWRDASRSIAQVRTCLNTHTLPVRAFPALVTYEPAPRRSSVRFDCLPCRLRACRLTPVPPTGSWQLMPTASP